jgi:hypothetical protein
MIAIIRKNITGIKRSKKLNKEIIGEKEINLSHELSNRRNVRKERLEVYECQYQRSFIALQNFKTT